MSSLNFLRLAVLAVVAMLPLLSGCGSSNSQSNFNPVTKTHTDPNWLPTAHVTAARTNLNNCADCHGVTFTGGIANVSCMSPNTVNGLSCHATSPANNPTGCKSCHGTPPDGTQAPNRAAAHAKHLTMADVTCATCHQGAGSGTAVHARGTDPVPSLPVTFRAKTVVGSYGYNLKEGSCSAVVCHGGVKTPNWNKGSINITKDCLICHTQGAAPETPQYNSFWSGNTTVYGGVSNLHEVHIGLITAMNKNNNIDAVACASCHNSITQTKNHFPKMYNKTAAPVKAANTIGGAGTAITAYTPFTAAVPSGGCATTCHATRYWVNK